MGHPVYCFGLKQYNYFFCFDRVNNIKNISNGFPVELVTHQNSKKLCSTHQLGNRFGPEHARTHPAVTRLDAEIDGDTVKQELAVNIPETNDDVLLQYHRVNQLIGIWWNGILYKCYWE